MKKSRLLTAIAVLALVAVPLFAAGCGGDDDDNGTGGGSGGSSNNGGGASGTKTKESGGGATGGGGQTLKIAADPGGALKFDKSSLSAKAGKVTIVMDNPSDLPHAVEIEGNGVEFKGETVTKGGVSKASGDLKAGKYEFYCPVDAHKQAGMEGTLTVS
jgi:plastocyanin